MRGMKKSGCDGHKVSKTLKKSSQIMAVSCGNVRDDGRIMSRILSHTKAGIIYVFIHLYVLPRVGWRDNIANGIRKKGLRAERTHDMGKMWETSARNLRLYY